MALLPSKSALPKRVILRAHSDWFPVHDKIVNTWFFRSGYCQQDQTYLWPEGGHYMRIGFQIQERFHIIIDMNKDAVENGDMTEVPYEIWKVVESAGEVQ